MVLNPFISHVKRVKRIDNRYIKECVSQNDVEGVKRKQNHLQFIKDTNSGFIL